MVRAVGSKGPIDKDNQSRGGSKRWTGKGPAPARHIPWPEIFKHHISVVEGHYKMLDMVRKHTVEGTSNHNTIMGCLDRAQKALDDSKWVSRNFVEPAGNRDKVPIGSSSISMYPGYSPADHQYGDAAQEAGNAKSRTRQEGGDVEMTEDVPQHRLGQEYAGRRGGTASANGINGFKAYESALPHRKSASGTNAVPVAERKRGPEAESKPMFVFDSNPTPVNVPVASSKPNKRSGSPISADDTAAETNGVKKAKTKHTGDANGEEVEKDDITERVEARLKEKEEKRRKKKEQKRKRESEASADDAAAAAAAAVTDEAEAEEATETKSEKPKKKKSKKSKDDSLAAEDEAAGEEKPKKKKKSDKKKDKK